MGHGLKETDTQISFFPMFRARRILWVARAVCRGTPDSLEKQENTVYAARAYDAPRARSPTLLAHIFPRSLASLLQTLRGKMELGDLRLRCGQTSRNGSRQSVNTEPFVDRTFRGGTTGDDDFQLKVLTNEHPDYASLKEQFFTKWIKPVYSLRVERIFKVQVGFVGV